MSPLAEERIGSSQKKDSLRMPLHVPLPMPRDLYAQDSQSPGRSRISTRCIPRPWRSTSFRSLRAIRPRRSATTARRGPASTRRPEFFYAPIAALLALWDGKSSDQLGGTSQAVRFHHHDASCPATRRRPRQDVRRWPTTRATSFITSSVPAAGRDGEPAPGLLPLTTTWYTADSAEPRTSEMPLRHRQVFERANEFSANAQAHAEEIPTGSYPLHDQ
jgi:hypothetical protein